jgi:hypothetical protein
MLLLRNVSHNFFKTKNPAFLGVIVLEFCLGNLMVECPPGSSEPTSVTDTIYDISGQCGWMQVQVLPEAFFLRFAFQFIL